MADSIERRIAQSRSDTVNLVWPILAPQIGGGDLLQVEGFAHLHPVLKFLDAMAGIDHIIFQDSVGIGLASRIQNGDAFDYDTWTVRYELHNGRATEYARHLKQLSTRGAIKPLYWCQAYISTKPQRRVLRLAVAYAADVIGAVGDESLGWLCPPNGADGNRFWAISWKAFRDTGAWVWTWNNGVWTGPTTAKPKQLELGF
jgi:hypothetical protein